MDLDFESRTSIGAVLVRLQVQTRGAIARAQPQPRPGEHVAREFAAGGAGTKNIEEEPGVVVRGGDGGVGEALLSVELEAAPKERRFKRHGPRPAEFVVAS